MKNILVVGGAGFIGSHVVKQLYQSGYQPIILDNLSSGSRKAVTQGIFFEGDLADINLLNRIFSTHSISAVMHFAAFINIRESVADPLKYYENNLRNTLNLLHAMRKHDVNVCVFSSSAAVYGLPKQERITECHPCNPINPYGRSKWMVENILQDFDQAYGMKFCCLRYFNAAGGDPEFEVKNYKKVENNLIPIILRNVKFGNCTATIFGRDYPTEDGTCVRDYIHIYDLAKAHIATMERLFQGHPSCNFNLGTGTGFSVLQVINEIQKVINKKINIIESIRRPGDPPVLVADGMKAKEVLGWSPKFPDLTTMIHHAWEAIV